MTFAILATNSERRSAIVARSNGELFESRGDALRSLVKLEETEPDLTFVVLPVVSPRELAKLQEDYELAV